MTTFRWERADPNGNGMPTTNEWYYVDAEDRIVGGIWRDGGKWLIRETDGEYCYFTELAAKHVVEQAVGT